MKNLKISAAVLAAATLAGCTTPPRMVEHTLPYRTVRFPGGNYSALAVSNGLAVTSSHWSREDCGGVFDISSPTNVRMLLRYPCKGYSCANPVFFGDRCYVPNMFSISVLNLKDRAHPKFEGVINPQFPKHGGNQLWVADGALYFETDKDVYKVRPDGLAFDKVVGVKPPKRVSTKKLTDEAGRVVSIEGGALTVDGHELPYAYDLSTIAVQNDIAWVYAPCRSAKAALIPIETSAGCNPNFYPRVPAVDIPRTNAYQTMGMQTAGCVTRVGDLLFADDGIAKLGRRGEATFVRNRTRAASNMSVDGNRIAIAQCAYCRVMDFSDLDNIKTVDFAPPADRPLHLTGCALEGNRLYVCYTLKETPKMDFIYRQPERGFVASFDTADPSEPLSVVETPACIAMAKVGDFLYVTGRQGDFMIVDAKDANALRLSDVRDDLQSGQAYKIKRFASGVYLLNGARIVQLDVTYPAYPQVRRIFNRGENRASPGYDDFTVEGDRLYALAHASVDVFPLKGCPIDPIVDDCGVKGVDDEALEPVDAAVFAGHVRQTKNPSWWAFEAGRAGNCCGAYVYDWVRLADGTYAVAYGEAGVVLCDRNGRFRAELPRPTGGYPVFASAVLEKDGDVYMQDDAGKAYRAFRDVLGDRRDLKGRWCSLGTSITWYNDHVDNAGGRFTRGYQDRVMEKLRFTDLDNAGISGGRVGDQYVPAAKADYYTIEHGINDWGKSTPVGTFADYTGNAKNGTFYANYRVLMDKVRAKNPAAKIILCTPRKGYGFGTYLPKRCDEAKNGICLVEYVDAVRMIAAHEKLPVADFYTTCGEQDELAGLSIDVALHPNDAGYRRMAAELLRVFSAVAP